MVWGPAGLVLMPWRFFDRSDSPVSISTLEPDAARQNGVGQAGQSWHADGFGQRPRSSVRAWIARPVKCGRIKGWTTG